MNEIYEYKAWHENGQMCVKSFYAGNKQVGECKFWHKNGQLHKHCFYVNGELHGEYKQWYENGQLWSHFFYVNGELHGEYKALTVCRKLNAHSFLSAGLDITAEVKSLVDDISVLTSEDRLLIKLKYGIECLPELE